MVTSTLRTHSIQHIFEKSVRGYTSTLVFRETCGECRLAGVVTISKCRHGGRQGAVRVRWSGWSKGEPFGGAIAPSGPDVPSTVWAPLSPAAGELCEQNPEDEDPLLGRRPSSQQLRAQEREGGATQKEPPLGCRRCHPGDDIRPGRSLSGWAQLNAAPSRGGNISQS